MYNKYSYITTSARNSNKKRALYLQTPKIKLIMLQYFVVMNSYSSQKSKLKLLIVFSVYLCRKECNFRELNS